jgi:hypothetical protein
LLASLGSIETPPPAPGLQVEAVLLGVLDEVDDVSPVTGEARALDDHDHVALATTCTLHHALVGRSLLLRSRARTVVVVDE